MSFTEISVRIWKKLGWQFSICSLRLHENTQQLSFFFCGLLCLAWGINTRMVAKILQSLPISVTLSFKMYCSHANGKIYSVKQQWHLQGALNITYLQCIFFWQCKIHIKFSWKCNKTQDIELIRWVVEMPCH